MSPAEPRGNDDFKLPLDDTRYLARKLSSGAKKTQRGYPPQVSLLPEKVTAAPAPALTIPGRATANTGGRRFQRFSDSVFRFLPPEERADHGQGPLTDGFQFTQPLYSSFSKSGVFEGGPPIPLAVRDATVQGARPARARQAYSAPAGLTGGGLGQDMDWPESAAPAREGMRMTSLLQGGGSLRSGVRGKPPTHGIRSGGFQLMREKESRK